ncbi:hypothetical protein M0R45_028692 [Rubus argutus]|uniref:Pentatricopeptide repeat-containing protein n=1 Tax=Rubus argutus TaxID=59490 RepID=A0AAW1W5F7_RUBAR
MLASKVTPNAYTYSVLIETLAGDPDPKFLAVAKNVGREDEAKQFLEDMKAKGFEPDEKAVREVLMGRRGPMVRSLFNILFGK